MEDISIYDGGLEISRIIFSRIVGNVVPALERCADGQEPLPVYIIHDMNVSGYVDLIDSAASASGRLEICGKYGIVASEENKTMSTVLDISGWLLEKEAGRNAFILAAGGGITTDMAGFAASIYKRGVRFAYVPTTLLAQTDAAIGGKTGVNQESYKNMLGTIRQPEFTFICASVLETLPFRDFMSGVAELLKTFLIEDDGWYGRAVTYLSGLRQADDRKEYLKAGGAALQELIHAAASVKAGVVSRDQFETGERRKLNLGHTFAHAIEKNARLHGDDITHGEAVSIGMVMAADLSEKAGVAEPGLKTRLLADFRSAGLPVDCPYPVDSLVDAMSRDKKAENGLIHFVLLSAPGSVEICDMTADRAARLLGTDTKNRKI